MQCIPRIAAVVLSSTGSSSFPLHVKSSCSLCMYASGPQKERDALGSYISSFF